MLRNPPTKVVLGQYIERSYRRRLIPGMAQHQGVVGGLTPSCREGVTPDYGLGALAANFLLKALSLIFKVQVVLV